MERKCSFCGNDTSLNEIFCNNCGAIIDKANVSYCVLCRRPVNKGIKKCDNCCSIEQLALLGDTYKQAAASKDAAWQNYNPTSIGENAWQFSKLLNNCIKSVAILSLILLGIWMATSMFQNKLQMIYQSILPPVKTSAYALGSFEMAHDLFVLKEHEAEENNYTDGNKSMDIIIRFDAMVSYDLSKIRIVDVNSEDENNQSIEIILPKPNIDTILKPYASRTGKSGPAGITGVEIYDSKGNFEVGDDDKIVDNYLQDWKNKNSERLSKMAMETTSKKLTDFAKSLNISISKISVEN